jgi:hypothetical protein
MSNFPNYDKRRRAGRLKISGLDGFFGSEPSFALSGILARRPAAHVRFCPSFLMDIHVSFPYSASVVPTVRYPGAIRRTYVQILYVINKETWVPVAAKYRERTKRRKTETSEIMRISHNVADFH